MVKMLLMKLGYIAIPFMFSTMVRYIDVHYKWRITLMFTPFINMIALKCHSLGPPIQTAHLAYISHIQLICVLALHSNYMTFSVCSRYSFKYRI